MNKILAIEWNYFIKSTGESVLVKVLYSSFFLIGLTNTAHPEYDSLDFFIEGFRGH